MATYDDLPDSIDSLSELGERLDVTRRGESALYTLLEIRTMAGRIAAALEGDSNSAVVTVRAMAEILADDALRLIRTKWDSLAGRSNEDEVSTATADLAVGIVAIVKQYHARIAGERASTLTEGDVEE